MSSNRVGPVLYIPDFVNECYDALKYSPCEMKKGSLINQMRMKGIVMYLRKRLPSCFLLVESLQ
eukprot:116249-Ditylum_brightwellii.AAC.1